MLNGLDLFSGIGGISVALSDWVRPIAYCEIDPYCQAVLLSRQHEGKLHKAPIWDDVRTIQASVLPSTPNIICGGFPCQDISIAGNGKGLDGERSGLYWEIHRLAKEIFPNFIFLENVPAICTKGGWEVVSSLTEIGYDCRWCTLSAAQCGAVHKRERWFCLARNSNGIIGNQGKEQEVSFPWKTSNTAGICEYVANAVGSRGWKSSNSLGSEAEPEMLQPNHRETHSNNAGKSSSDVANPKSSQCSGLQCREKEGQPTIRDCGESKSIDIWQKAVSEICRVTDGIPFRLDRIRGLGNSVVPIQAKTAFKYLMGFV